MVLSDSVFHPFFAFFPLSPARVARLDSVLNISRGSIGVWAGAFAIFFSYFALIFVFRFQFFVCGFCEFNQSIGSVDLVFLVRPCVPCSFSTGYFFLARFFLFYRARGILPRYTPLVSHDKRG